MKPPPLKNKKKISASLKKALVRGKDFLIRFSLALSKILNFLKAKLISKLFWGRSYYYKNITQAVILFITLSVVVFGLMTRLEASSNTLEKGNSISGLEDLLLQGGSIETVLVSNQGGLAVDTQNYAVQDGDTLDSIAKKFNLKNADTIKWANLKELSLETILTGKVPVGMVLVIPSIDGVLYEVKAGDTLDSIIANASLTNTEANRSNLIEFNNLEEPYTLTAGEQLFIPEGNLRTSGIGPLSEIPKGIFINPMQNPECKGYHISRGFSSYHNGVDMAHYPFCPISAVASGIVTYAGWSVYGEGYNVRIDHGGGIVTHYYHGSGEIWVKVGDHVQQGQLIMREGTTGNSTGPHLHFSMFLHKVAIDPAPYVPGLY